MSGLGVRAWLSLGLGALLIGGVALWLAADRRATRQREQAQREEWRATSEAERLEAQQRLDAAVTQALDRAAAEQAGVQAELQSRLDAEHAQLESVTAERDQALADLAEAGNSHGLLEQQLAETKDQRLQQIGEAARLLEQVLERDRRLEVLNRSLAELREQSALAARPAAVVTVARGDSPAARVSDALRRSGAQGAAVLEAQLGEDGALHNVLVRLSGDQPLARVITAQRASLAVTTGRPSLRLEGLSGDVGDSPGALDIDLPAFDAEAWSALGLAVPAPFRAVGEASAALSVLLEPFGWHLDELQGVAGANLLGVELTQHDGSGNVLRTLRAPRARLGAGPELTLWDGAVTTGGDERAFFEGIFRLPLPGLDTAAWDEALGL